MIGQGPLYYIPKFMEIGALSLKEEDCYDFSFYHIWAWKPSGHVTYIILTYFHFLVPKSLHTKFRQKGEVVSEKNKF